MSKIPQLMNKELDRLAKEYSTLCAVYHADIEWLENGTFWLSGDDLKLAKWFDANTALFEKEFLKRVSKR